MNKIDNLSKYSPLVLRIAIGFVFIWFGWSSIFQTDMWVRLVPEWATALLSAAALVKIHGVVELVFGVFVVVGVYTRISALILFLSILHTVFLVSGPTQARDISITIATLALAIYKKPVLSQQN